MAWEFVALIVMAVLVVVFIGIARKSHTPS